MYEYNAIVIRVYDGDTIRADLDLGFGIWLKNQSIRLRGIDTPEVRGDNKEEGFISRDRLRVLLEEADNKCVIKTVKDDQTGKYGRIVGEILTAKHEKSLNDILIDEGLAVPYM
jgi:micrococcal nuclease